MEPAAGMRLEPAVCESVNVQGAANTDMQTNQSHTAPVTHRHCPCLHTHRNLPRCPRPKLSCSHTLCSGSRRLALFHRCHMLCRFVGRLTADAAAALAAVAAAVGLVAMDDQGCLPLQASHGFVWARMIECGRQKDAGGRGSSGVRISAAGAPANSVLQMNTSSSQKVQHRRKAPERRSGFIVCQQRPLTHQKRLFDAIVRTCVRNRARAGRRSNNNVLFLTPCTSVRQFSPNNV